MFLFQIFKQKSVKNLVSCPLGKQHLIKVKTPLQKEYPVSFQVALLLYKKKIKIKETQFQALLLTHLNWVVRNGHTKKAQKC